MELATLLGNLSMGLPFVLSGMKSRVVGVLFCKDLNMLLLFRYAERLQVQSFDHLDAEELKFTCVIASYLP